MEAAFERLNAEELTQFDPPVTECERSNGMMCEWLRG